MAARELRYRWFARLCQEEGYSALCVAHNANDNAETLFLNLVRGTGLKGLSGMGEESEVPYSEDGVHVRLLRPLLPFSRKLRPFLLHHPAGTLHILFQILSGKQHTALAADN